VSEVAKYGDYRPAAAFRGMRTVCHGCRTEVSELVTDSETGASHIISLTVPGDGTVSREVATADGTRRYVEEPCPVCGDSDDPGWVPGFVPPM
jgi:hypothetical protein